MDSIIRTQTLTHMKNRTDLSRLSIILLFLIPTVVFGQVELPKLISDGLVLQRDAEVKIWGRASASEKITIRFLGNAYRTVAGNNGAWEIRLSGLNAGGPHEMVIEAKNTIRLRDILIGDVWVASGQSNMELPMRRVKPLYDREISEANNDYIRFFNVPQTYDFNLPRDDFESGSWHKTDPRSVLDFSAAAYFFADELYQRYRIPIGIIDASLGGSPAEAWMSEEALKKFPHHYQEAQRFKETDLIERIEREDLERSNAWYAELNRKDTGLRGPVRWSDPAADDSDWTEMEIPGYWADTNPGYVHGVVWFRKHIYLTGERAGQSAELNLGAIVDADSVFINGKFIGTTSYQYPPRWYSVPEGVFEEGKNTIVVRVVNVRGRGGFVPDKPYYLAVAKDTIDLAGRWRCRLGAEMEPLAGQTFIRWKPLGLFNAMLSPLLRFAIKGVIWYQGESNTGRAVEYRELFPAMIMDWRRQWNRGDLPFLFVQLANFMEAKPQPSESDWAMLREAQHKTLSLPHTGMAVAIDIGEWNDIHPLNKKDVGKRLALSARKIAYGEDIVNAGPEFRSMHIEGNKIVLSFNNIGSGLTAKNGPLRQFAVAGEDARFVRANADIVNDRVIVWSDEISEPVAVRYAWADNPEGANLYNREGLPAVPFRTDDF